MALGGDMSEVDPGEKIVGGKFQEKVVFNSSDLAQNLDDRRRFALWRDQWNALYGSADLIRAENRPFGVQFEFVALGSVGLGRFDGAITRTVRTARDVAADNAENFCLVLRDSRSRVLAHQNGRDIGLDRSMAVLLTNADPGEIQGETGIAWCAINVSRRHLLQAVANADDLICTLLDGDNEALRHLQRYVGILLGPDGIGDDPTLTERVGNTIVDLVALSLGAQGDALELASMRGLRAARLQAILAAIKTSFADPAFSSQSVAASLGLSRRYVNDLLYESGSSFTERVMELRLQKASAMLSDRCNDKLKVSEIAYACGFNEASYFNRCFRSRFGAPPTHFRGNGRG
jgi:AraC-like DNA-binding protein